jgi:hypothetical protein
MPILLARKGELIDHTENCIGGAFESARKQKGIPCCTLAHVEAIAMLTLARDTVGRE